MPNRRNFNPSASSSDYEHRHIKFRAMVEVNLHNVGGKFELRDAVNWLNDAIERGLKLADPNDEAAVVNGSAELISRPHCRCYKESAEKES